MKKFNLLYKTHLLRISAVLCLLLSYLWIAPGQVHALSAGSQGYYYDHWEDGYRAALLNPVQLAGDDINSLSAPTTVSASAQEETQAQTFGLSLEEYLWPTDPLQTDNLSLSISKGDVPQTPSESNPSAPLQQEPTLTVEIVSSPYATVDHNGVPGVTDGEIPEVFVVEAVITNTGPVTDVVVHLDFNPGNGWMLLGDEDPDRIAYDLAPDNAYHAYWFARYPQVLPPVITATHQYTVTAAPAANPADPVAASATVETRETQSTANQSLTYASAEIVVGVAFTVTTGFDLGNDPEDAIFSPVGNPDFDPGAYRLTASEVRFYDDDGMWEETVSDRLYFPTLHSSAENAEVTYTFLALTPENTRLCPYAGIDFDPAKYDHEYCSESMGTIISIEGTVSLSLTKQVSDSEIQQGQLLTYTISYINDGDYDLVHTWIWDDVPSDKVSIIADSISPSPTLTTGNRIAWQLGTIPIADTGTFTFTVLVDGNGVDLPDGDKVVNNALFGIIPGNFPEEPKPARTSTVTTTVHAPMIALSKTDGRDTAQPGDLLTYTLLITNSSSTIATSDLVITDELPAGVTLAGTTTPGFDSQSPDGRTLVWDSQDIPAGDTLEVTIPVVVDLDVPNGTILTNTATATYMNTARSHTFDAETDDDTTIVQAPVLTFTKTAEDLDGPPLVVSDTVRYTLQVTNTGSYTAYNVTVTDDLPDQVTCTDVSGDYGTLPGCDDDPLVWSIPSLAPYNTTASLYITVTINAGSEGQTITNTATVTGTNVPPIEPPPVCPDGSEPVDGVCPTPEPLDTELDFTKTAEDLNGGHLVVGDEILYTLQVTNTGTYTAFDVTVTDDLPDGVSYVDDSADQGETSGTDPVVWTIPELPAGSNNVATLWITVTIAEGTEGQTITNTGSVTATNVPNPPDDPPPVCPDGSEPVGGVCPTPVPTTTLAFTKTAEDVDGPPLVVGDTIRYTLQVTNTGTYTAYNVTVTDDLPDQVECQGVSGDSAPAACADPLEWSIPSLATDTTASLYITVTIKPGSEGQTITNTGSVTGENVPPIDPPPPVCPDGSEPVGGVCPTPLPPETDLDFTKTAEDVDGGYLVVGDEILYTLQVTNIGDYTAYNVTVTDDLPDQVTCQAVSGDSAPAGCADPLVWSIPSLATDTTASLYIMVTINEGTEGQTITNTGSVTGTNVPPIDPPPPVCPDGSAPDPVSGECPATPVQVADLAVNKEVNEGTPDEGDTIVYIVTVTNNGPNDATTVVLTDILPAGVTYAAHSTSQGSYNSGSGRWDVGNLPHSDVATLTITAMVDGGTGGSTIVNTADGLSADQADPVTSNNQGSASITVNNDPGIIVVKEANVDTAEVEGIIIYTYWVTNTGNVTLDPVTLSDDRLGLITLVSDSLAPGAGTSGTRTYQVQESDLPGPLTNTATVTGTPPVGSAVTDTDSESVELSTAASGASSIYLPIIMRNY